MTCTYTAVVDIRTGYAIKAVFERPEDASKFARERPSGSWMFDPIEDPAAIEKIKKERDEAVLALEITKAEADDDACELRGLRSDCEELRDENEMLQQLANEADERAAKFEGWALGYRFRALELAEAHKLVRVVMGRALIALRERK